MSRTSNPLAVIQGYRRAAPITISERSAPSTPASGLLTIYATTGGALAYKNDAGTEVVLSGGGGGGGTVDAVVAGDGIDVDATDPANPIVDVDSTVARRNASNTFNSTYNLFADGSNYGIEIGTGGAVKIFDGQNSTNLTMDAALHTLHSQVAAGNPVVFAFDDDLEFTIPSVAYNFWIKNAAGVKLFDIDNAVGAVVLNDSGGYESLNANARTLTSSNAWGPYIQAEWESYFNLYNPILYTYYGGDKRFDAYYGSMFYEDGTTEFFNANAGEIYDLIGDESISAPDRTLKYSGIDVVAWGSQSLTDSSNYLSQNWTSRNCYGADGSTVTFNYSAQASHISDPTGGAVQDTQARSAINAILDILEARSLMA